MTAIRTFAALALLLAATSPLVAAPRTLYPPPPPPQYPATGGWVRPYVSSRYGPSGNYRSPVPNAAQNSIEYELNMGAGSGRY